MWYLWTRPTIEEHRIEPENLLGHRLLLIFAFIMLLTIILGMNTDVWVAYKQDPNFTINLKHKHQLSAGIYFNLYFQMWHRAKSPQLRLHLPSKYLSQRPFLISYMFLVNMLDNLAAFDWFPLNLGYQDVYLDGPSVFSFDKVYHALGSSFFTILTIYLLTSVYRGTIFSIFGNVLWEIFEISIQPAEFGDSGLDLIFDIFATLLTAVLISRNFGDKGSPSNNHMRNSIEADLK